MPSFKGHQQLDPEELCEMYARPLSLQQIADRKGVDRITIRRHLLRAGVKLRPQGGNHREHINGGSGREHGR